MRDDIDSPLGLAKEVQQLMKLPQHLCKQRGICCRVATFKGSLSYQQIVAIAADPSHPHYQSAHDFYTIFQPYPSQNAVRTIAPEFVERVRQQSIDSGSNPDDVSFFCCKFVLPDGRCGVHEDRPVGCRVYPFPHEKTVYHPGCGFEQQGTANWERIKEILDTLGLSPDLSEKKDADH